MLELAEPRRHHAHLEAALLELGEQVAEPARQPREGVELRVEVREEPVRLEPPLGLDEHHLERVLLEQGDRVELGVERPGDGVGLGQRLPDEREARRQPDAVVERDAL